MMVRTKCPMYSGMISRLIRSHSSIGFMWSTVRSENKIREYTEQNRSAAVPMNTVAQNSTSPITPIAPGECVRMPWNED